VGLLVWLSACSPPLGVSGGGPSLALDPPDQSSPTPQELLARRAIPLTPTATLRATATVTLTPDLTATQLAALAMQPSVTVATETPTEVPTAPAGFSICAPLKDILREDLPRLISDGYHPPPRSRPDDRHEGVDIAYYHWKGLGPIAKTPITSVLAGKVAAALKDTFPYGNFVIVETPGEAIPEEIREALNISTGQSLYLLYAHMEEDSLQVSLGDSVSACQIVGAVGRTGNTQAYHLHLETRLGPPGASFDSMSNFTDSATDEEKRNYRLWRVSGKYVHFDPMELLLYGLETPTATPRQSLPLKENE
jgi:murein DD-endopeptidase MepM/ murein hydrolase activator NlpD